jgi:hypothetical protein
MTVTGVHRRGLAIVLDTDSACFPLRSGLPGSRDWTGAATAQAFWVKPIHGCVAPVKHELVGEGVVQPGDVVGRLGEWRSRFHSIRSSKPDFLYRRGF